MRIGNGYDVHAFDNNKVGAHIILGGINIPHTQSIKAHSDGDVLIHALCDALLGALALGDIGFYFPDTDTTFKDIDSQILLKKVITLIHSNAYQLSNCDCTIVAQVPKMAPHIISMRKNLAQLMGVEKNAVSVKATTTENLGFTGREEGIAVYASVLLKPLS